MSFTEIVEELPRLSADERHDLLNRLVELDDSAVFEETPEMLAAIDEGIHSMETEPSITLEEARRSIPRWTSR